MQEKLVLVAGATGDLGGTIARVLLSEGRNVRVLVRPKSKYNQLVRAGAQAVFGDLKDPATLYPACKGVETLVTTANSARRGGDDNATTVDLLGNRNLIDAAKAQGVKQFIFISMYGATPDSPVPFVSAKAKTEEYLRSSGIPYTIIAPNAFMDVWIAMVVGLPAATGQPVTIVGQGQRKHSFVSAADVAKFIIASINNPRALNQTLNVGGPEAVSLCDAVKAFEHAIGDKTISVNSVAPGQPIPGLPEFMAGMLASLEFFDSPIDMKELSATYGIKLTSLTDFATGFITSLNK